MVRHRKASGKIMATAACLACPEGRPAPGGGTGIPPGLTG
ncbi:hypothetical protein DESPIGER_1161 [Desulfovibrio piger]|uniref:Uncharacterized protein n=1 Tax=Desulfovibrio piger TaxID=901 RepID=A0A1K1LE88_9BACT|nr:hypothetical protein DESPIGER_1161 [Desulfovibrio piger]